MSNQFVHLHAHSEYSLLDGSIKVKNLVKRARELEMPAIALTDHGNMFGMVHFYRAARAEGIKPILGIEAYITRGSRHDRSRGQEAQKEIDHLILLARTVDGYHNLLRLSSIAYLEGFYYKPRIDFEVLEQHSEGLIGTTACLRGTVAQAALGDGLDAARKVADRYRDIFGADNYFIEMQDHGLEPQKKLNKIYRKLSKDMNVPLIASNDVHYLHKDDSTAHEVLLCLQTGSLLDDPHRFRFSSNELYLKTEKEMRALFPDTPEAIENTVGVADMCDVELDQGTLHLPKFPLPEGFDSASGYLRHLSYEGAKRRYGEITDQVKERLEFELDVIDRMEFSGYFLIVRDIVDFARENGIPVGPGRGSAAGSLVTYSVGITDVEPLEHNLLFERMLNPERVSMPDIDIDFCFERRDEVIRYVIDRYGSDNVCQIITFGTMAARGSVRDVGRVLGLPYDDVDRIAKLIPAVPGQTLDDALENVPDLRTLVKSGGDYGRLMKLCRTLEGVSRHTSTHAAGMVITPTPLVNHLPLYKSSRGEITTQYDMKSIDAIGLLKIDVLGLRTLTVIDKALRMVRENHGVELKAEDIPLDDEKTFELLRSGRTVGVFQLESEGMRELLRNLKPTLFTDIIAVNALYRPGPLGSNMHVTFVDCKHGRAEIEYGHPSLEPILRDTYGVILYQEQVMQIASSMAGFSLGEADILRKAMGKKILEVMDEQKKKFLDGAKNNDIAGDVAAKIWERMAEFAKYGFNKSHSAAYAVISMRTAFLKANYPAEFLAATMSSEMDDTDRITILLDDCREAGIELVSPNINTCEKSFRARDGRIYYGLAAVKNVGVGAVESIIEERDDGGSFRSLENLCCRVNSRVVTRRVYESLIASGALDALPGHRAQKMTMLDTVMERAARKFRDHARGQFGLFGEVEDGDEVNLPDVEPWPPAEQLQQEKEALGFFLSGHPLDRYRDVINMFTTSALRSVRDREAGERAVISGVVSSVKFILDRNQRTMAFVTLEDKDGQAEVVVFADVVERTRSLLEDDKIILVDGKVSRRGGGDGKLLVDNIVGVSDDEFPRVRELHCTIDIESVGVDTVSELRSILEKREGGARLFFHVKENGQRPYVIRSRGHGVHLDFDVIAHLAETIGSENLRAVPAGNGP